MWVTAFIIVVFAGVEAGLASAVGLSLLIVLWKVPAGRSPRHACASPGSDASGRWLISQVLRRPVSEHAPSACLVEGTLSCLPI